MSFVWRCAECGTNVLVEHESPDTMNRFAAPLCPKCYVKCRNEHSTWSGFMEDTQDNGYPIYQDLDGIGFYCEYSTDDINNTDDNEVEKFAKIATEIAENADKLIDKYKISAKSLGDLFEDTLDILLSHEELICILDCIEDIFNIMDNYLSTINDFEGKEYIYSEALLYKHNITLIK